MAIFTRPSKGAAIGVCGKQVYDTLHAFYGRPFSTTLTRQRASVMDFPAVTLCNMNMISKKQYSTAAKEWQLPGSQNQTKEQLREEIQAMLSIFSHREFKAEYLQKFRIKVFSNPLFEERGPNFKEFLKGLSHGIEGILSLDWLSPCTWRGKTCSPLNFTSFVNLKMGQCYTFNSGKKGQPKLKSVVSGPTNGLRLKLNLEEEDHVSNDYVLESGFKVLVHDQNEYPMIEGAEGFALQPGTHTFAALREKRFKNLPTPYKTNCASPDQPFNKYFSFSYSINACFKQCMHEYIIGKCGCQALDNIIHGVELCSVKDAFDCLYPTIPNDFPDNVVKCSNTCPEPCEYTKYEAKLSYAAPVDNAFSRAFSSSRLITNLTSESFKTFLNRTEKDKQEFIRNNVVSLDVFFESLGYDVIEQKPVFDDWALIGAVGGTLGLFLGTSILTGLEFLDFLASCLIRALRRKRIPPKEEELGEINHSMPKNPVI
ncbi:acid-sensing ion channel 1A-like isoform X2 [Actinia tenebrosa]|uniref:Acid-sensing ion channel 1A-like isoform X2 n=1 Tax=Actinia tenebrosa TaxID=6105 RepID=A0A6P8H146_ACTTE|nr:acid-sensing ion channel 1A-like isoform X2 [Actinia tenebrosa]